MSLNDQQRDRMDKRVVDSCVSVVQLHLLNGELKMQRDVAAQVADGFEAHVKALQTDVVDRDKHIAELQQTIVDYREGATVQRIANLADARKKEIRALHTIIARLRDELDGQRNATTACDIHIRELRADVANRDQQIAELQQTIVDYREGDAAYRKVADDRKTKIIALQRKIDALQEVIKARGATIRGLREDNAFRDHQAATASFGLLRAGIVNPDAPCKEQSEHIIRLRNRVDILQKDNIAKDKRVTEYAVLLDRIQGAVYHRPQQGYQAIVERIAKLLREQWLGENQDARAKLIDAHSEKQAYCLGRVHAVLAQRGLHSCDAILDSISKILLNFRDGEQ